jgi:proline iminopeptidase
MPDYIKAKMAGPLGEHLDRYLATNGADGHLLDMRFAGGHDNTPTLLLFTIGRKSGDRIVLPLIYGVDGDSYVIVASKGGAPVHPGWYLNLVETPECDIQVGSERFKARARDAVGAERQRLWEMMVEVYPPYTDYQQATSREIPVVVLDRAQEP